MARVTYLKCDRCGKQYEIGNQYKINEDGQEFTINSVRIGEWDQKNKRWKSLASGYDLCTACSRAIADVIFAGAENPMRMKKVDNTGRYAGRFPWSNTNVKTTSLEKDQNEFAAAQEDNDDGK